MKHSFLKPLLFLILVFVVISLVAFLTNAFDKLVNISWLLLAASAAFFVLSITLWLSAWGLLIKRKSRHLSLRNLLALGISCVYGALTPIQLGAEALRSIRLKKFYGISYADSVAASMVAKGVKFLLIALIAATVLVFFIVKSELSIMLWIGILSGFFVIALAAALFLLPFNKRIGFFLAGFFKKLAAVIPQFKRLHKYFLGYSSYLRQIEPRVFYAVFLLSLLSFLLEFLALFYCFLALSIFIPIQSILVLFVLISVLERTPVLPRGIGLVETVGFAFLSIPLLSSTVLSPEHIGAVIVAFDFVRLVIPTIISMTASVLLFKSLT